MSAPVGGGSIVRLRDVVFTYPGMREPSLEIPQLDVAAGELVAVTGPVGAGASTLLLVAGGYAPRLTGGELTGTCAAVARRPAVVFATPWTQLTGIAHTVLREVAFGPASRGLTAVKVADAARAALARLGIAHLEQRHPGTLSGGELQRVIIASALAQEPDLLLLDDPAAELDPLGADDVYALLAGLALGGVTVLVATPDVERAARVATRALVLAAGRVVRDGPPAAVLDDTDIAHIARAAGCPAPLPLDVAALAARMGR